MATLVYSVEHPDLEPFEMPSRFKHDVTYFMTPAGQGNAPAKLGPREYWVDLEQAAEWLDESVVELVSPLDSQNKTEIELTEEQEAWLEWLIANKVQHIRLEYGG